MSAITTKIVEKYNLSSKMSVSDLSQYTSEFLKNLTDDRKRNQARRRLRDGFKFSNDRVGILIPNQRSGKTKVTLREVKDTLNIDPPDSYQVPESIPQSSREETIRDLAEQIL